MNSQQAGIESERCLLCFDAPCIQACPTHIDVPKFIAMIRTKNVIGAAEVVKASNAMANTCGKICPEETFCQSVCTRGKQDAPIKIRELHFFATQSEAATGFSPTTSFVKNKKTVAVIGAGPSGLSCAFELAKHGYSVDVFDKAKPGGIPRTSIPAFRLSSNELSADTKFAAQFASFKKKEIDGKSFASIRKAYDAVFLAVGLGQDRALGIHGETLKGVIPVLEFLEKAKAAPSRLKVGKRVVVVGGGNVSLDAAATAKRLGAEHVILMYRRSEKEMRAWRAELDESRKQGVEIRVLTIPVSIVGKGNVHGIHCRRTELSRKKDKSGRRIPVEVKGSDFILNADTIIVAIGQVIQADWLKNAERTKSGVVRVNDHFRTSMDGVFAGGDLIAGEGTIVQSVAHGKHAAQAIHEFLKSR